MIHTSRAAIDKLESVKQALDSDEESQKSAPSLQDMFPWATKTVEFPEATIVYQDENKPVVIVERENRLYQQIKVYNRWGTITPGAFGKIHKRDLPKFWYTGKRIEEGHDRHGNLIVKDGYWCRAEKPNKLQRSSNNWFHKKWTGTVLLEIHKKSLRKLIDMRCSQASRMINSEGKNSTKEPDDVDSVSRGHRLPGGRRVRPHGDDRNHGP